MEQQTGNPVRGSAEPRHWRRPMVIGASGQVGTELCRFLELADAETVLRTSRVASTEYIALNLGSLKSSEDVKREIGESQPDAIFCAGAMTFVDGCEDAREQAHNVNARGPAAVAAYATESGIPLAFFSSDYVFSGSEQHPGPYTERDATAPLNAYGESKLAGEAAVLQACPAALVLRTTWVYGPDAAGKNFISYLVRHLRAGHTMRVPCDQLSTPTLNLDLARAACALLHAGASGVVHVAGEELLSREDLAHAIARVYGVDAGLIEGVSTAQLGQRAQRPLRSGLRSERLREWLPDWKPTPLEEGLRHTRAVTEQPSHPVSAV